MSAISFDEIIKMGNEAHADGYKDGFAAGDAAGFARGIAAAAAICRKLADEQNGQMRNYHKGTRERSRLQAAAMELETAAQDIDALLPASGQPGGDAGESGERR